MYGLTQAVGPVQPSPPHCPHSCAKLVEEAVVDVLVDDVVILIVDVVVLVADVVVEDNEVELPESTKVTTE